MITGDYHHTAIAVARDVGMVSPSAEMVIIDIPRQGQSQQHPNAPKPEGSEGQGGVGGQGWAGPLREAPEEEGGHTLEGQLSMAQTLLGHHPSWGLSSRDEEESPEQKLGNAPAGGASPKQPSAGRNAVAWGQLAPSAKEATQEAVPSPRLSHRHSILKPSNTLPTERYHKKVILPPLTVAPISHLSMPSDHPGVSQPALPSLGGAPLLTPAFLTLPDGTQAPVQGDLPMPAYGQQSEIQQTIGDHQEVQQTTAPALRPAGHDHQLPPLLIPISHPHQSSASFIPFSHPHQSPMSSTPISHDHQDPHVTHGSWSRPSLQLPPSPLHHHQDHQDQDDDHQGLAPASPSQQPMQGEALSSSSQQIPRLRFSRHSSLCMNPFLGLFTPTGFGCPPPAGRGFDPTPTPHAAPKPGLAGLRFLQVRGNQDCEGSWALSALAEGQLQCAVTGDALEHMLQLQDTSLLEAVVRSAVVFARMKPHQKGQVMDLIGSAGLHQLFEGQHRHIKVGSAQKWVLSCLCFCTAWLDRRSVSLMCGAVVLMPRNALCCACACAVLCYACPSVLSCAVLCCAVLCMSQRDVAWCTVLCHSALCYACPSM